ncbi:S1 family peptidase [Methyloferula stellata]|uniref:S1 family peptidase n=1 Tax=Methyloferula stellata TaxID=876270 RepID=UPI000365A762|nr:serine protease [Methyloferula stellata]
MRENRHFVCSTDISGREPARIGGAPAVNHYRALIDRVEALAGRDAASLFAEPVLPGGGARIATTISWYCAFEGAVIALDAIDEIARRPVAEKLSARLHALSPALRDRSIGEAFGTWLNIAAPSDIISVGGEPIFVDWGFLPAGVVTEPLARNDHFARTLGRFAPGLSLPPVEAHAVAEDSAPPDSNERTKVLSPPPTPIPEKPAVTDPAPHMGASSPPPPPLPPPIQAAAGRPGPWLAPLIACGVAAIGLIILLLPGVLKFPSKSTVDHEALEFERLHASNESLESQLKALQTVAGERVCRAGDPVVQVPGTGPSDPPSKMELLPRPPDQVPLPGQANKGTPDSATIASLLDAATVLVFAAKTEDSGTQGTGFFINDRNIVTNRHVVENSKDGGIVVASRSLGGVKRARLVATSAPKKEDNSINVDLAVLEVEPVANRTSLALGTTPAKLSTVYIAGFPGFITEKDVAFDNFVRKLSENPNDPNAGKSSDVTMPSPDMRYGRVNNIIRSGSDALPIILHDMQLAPGHSGGPLVDACGRLDGINSWDIRPEDGPQQANVAQDASILRSFLKDRNISFKSDDSACSNGPTLAQTPPVAPQTIPPPPVAPPPQAPK